MRINSKFQAQISALWIQHQRSAFWLLFAGVAAAALWVVSLPSTWQGGEVPRLFPDRVMDVIMLFLGQSLEGTVWPKSFWFELISLAAVLFTLSTALQVVFSFFSRVTSWFAVEFFYNGHVIICGLSRKGTQLALAHSAAGRKVIAVEKNPEHPGVQELRRMGLRVQIGDASVSHVMEAAGVLKASLVILTCSDQENFNILHAMEELAKAQKKAHPSCHLHIQDRHLFEELQSHEVGSRVARTVKSVRKEQNKKKPMGGNASFFNLAILGATRLLDWNPHRLKPRPLWGEIGEPNHFVMIGVGALGQEFVVQSTRRWALIHANKAMALRPEFHLVDPNAVERKAELLLENPTLSTYWRLEAHEMEINSSGFIGGEYLPAGIAEPRRIIVALPDDLQTLTAALSVLRQITKRGWTKTLIIVCIAEEEGVMWCDALRNNNTPWCRQLQPFSQLKEVLTVDFARYAPPEQIAILLHQEYLKIVAAENQARLLEGKPFYSKEEKPANVPWEILADEYRESNRQQAASILLELESLPIPRTVQTGSGESHPLEKDEIEYLAEREHNRWMAEKIANGWVYNKERNNILKLHPDILEWSDDSLKESTKDYDRNLVKNWEQILNQSGMRIVRKKVR